MKILIFIYELIFVISAILILKFSAKTKKYKIWLCIIFLCFMLVPFTNKKSKAERITLNVDYNGSSVILGKDMLKAVEINVFPKDARKNKIEYKSDDYSVARFENGYIKAVYPGETDVYVKCNDAVSSKVHIIVDYNAFSDISEEEGFVYVTSTGNTYHKKDCSTISPKITKLTEKEAKEKGMNPCKKCVSDK